MKKTWRTINKRTGKSKVITEKEKIVNGNMCEYRALKRRTEKLSIVEGVEEFKKKHKAKDPPLNIQLTERRPEFLWANGRMEKR